MRNDIQINFDEFINVFNENGKKAAILFASEKYNMSFDRVQRRIASYSNYRFDSSTRKYKCKNQNIIEAKFMSIEELDKNKTKIVTVSKEIEPLTGPNLNCNYDNLIQELIKDRFIELSKYISIDHVSKKLMINTQVLEHDGFNLVVI